MQIKHVIPFPHRQMHRIARQLRQSIQIWPGENCQWHFFARLKPQLNQFRPKQITHLRHHPKVALLDQTTGQPVRGTACGADQPGDFLQVACATGHRLHNAKPARQSLGPCRRRFFAGNFFRDDRIVVHDRPFS
ncbi:hypothetical protein ALQ39_02560 [Pseudomonas amygdali pv. eriobotryae]|uniref:Uncharacterized protein n=1 Tax=Pseudomonas amygdali pv. eriobotryae TaxID=129137 RepID=A0A3M3WW02_PSEA0|nr:hypothetical protein ALQ39_02560 [Pseudomonas amygdali pv. eriobotryae]